MTKKNLMMTPDELIELVEDIKVPKIAYGLWFYGDTDPDRECHCVISEAVWERDRKYVESIDDAVSATGMPFLFIDELLSAYDEVCIERHGDDPEQEFRLMGVIDADEAIDIFVELIPKIWENHKWKQEMLEIEND